MTSSKRRCSAVEVILLRDIQQLTAPEAAERLGISVDALKEPLASRARESARSRNADLAALLSYALRA